MKPDLTSFLGLHVTVVIDRPLGSRHPRYSDMVYPVNYGFVPDTVSGDGMPVDAYILGSDEPAKTAAGVVMAVIIREDDAEDKLVIAPVGKQYTAEQIMEQVEFQEHFFNSRIVT